MQVSTLALTAIALQIPANMAASHHSFTAEFDVNQPVNFTGTVTAVEWTNPHAWFHIDVEDDEGNVVNWSMELLGINRLLREGWARDEIKAGDVLYVEGYRARNGRPVGNCSVIVVVATGEQIWGSQPQNIGEI